MQHYIAIKRHPMRPKLSLGLFDELAEDWERKAKSLQIRRERLLKQRLRLRGRQAP